VKVDRFAELRKSELESRATVDCFLELHLSVFETRSNFGKLVDTPAFDISLSMAFLFFL
jgi:hypothetical protein